METGAFDEPREELPAALNAAMATDGERLVEQLMLLQQLPQVRLVPSSVFDRAKPPGSNPQLRSPWCELQATMLLKMVMEIFSRPLRDQSPIPCYYTSVGDV